MYEVGEIDFFWGIIELQWWHRTEDGMDIRKTKEMDMDIDKELHEFFGVELMQFTGLKDQNGRDIYENDIVRFIDGLGIVKYEEALASFYITYPFAGDWWNITIPDLFTDKDSQRLEVIGNTFENPELLEGTA